MRREDDGFLGTPDLGPASAPAVSIMVHSDESATSALTSSPTPEQLTDVDAVSNFLRNNYVQVRCNYSIKYAVIE